MRAAEEGECQVKCVSFLLLLKSVVTLTTDFCGKNGVSKSE